MPIKRLTETPIVHEGSSDDPAILVNDGDEVKQIPFSDTLDLKIDGGYADEDGYLILTAKGVPVGETVQKEILAIRDELGLDYHFDFE